MLDMLPADEDVLPSDEDVLSQQGAPSVAQHPEQQLVLWSPHQEPNTAVRLRLIGLLLLMLIVLGCAALTFGEFIWSSTTATVVLSPGEVAVQSTIATEEHVLQLSSTVTGQKMVASTGEVQQPARRAAGVLTFYNIATFSQTIPAGSIVTGADGVSIATDYSVTVQAGNPPAEASVDIPAHATGSGTGGNIRPGDIGMIPCCANIRLNGVVVDNSYAFQGGQDAATFAVVSQHDIDTASIPLEATEQQTAQTNLQGQVPRRLQLLDTFQCAATVHADPAVGARGMHSTVTVTETCNGHAYDQNAALQTATQAFMSQYMSQPLVGYRLLVSGVQLKSVSLSSRTKGTLSCTVQVQGQWLYQFGRQQMTALKQKIAGLTYSQAKAVLQHTSSIRLVELRLSGGNTVPVDQSQISVIVTPLT